MQIVEAAIAATVAIAAIAAIAAMGPVVQRDMWAAVPPQGRRG